MHITKKSLSPTKLELTIVADQRQLDQAKEVVINELAQDVNMSGFRKGKAPKSLIEKSIDPSTMQSRFLDTIINDLYSAAVRQERIHPVEQPEVSVTKYVPYDTLEMTATVEAVGEITLGNYKKIKVSKKAEATTEKDVTAVLDDIRSRDSAKKDVKRSAKDGDEVTINFSGVDAKSKALIDGATGTDYPLVLGSGTFIPGFEPEVIGLTIGKEKTFDITFPKDYGSIDLQNKKVTFTITVTAIKAVTVPKLDDTFAAKVGPFKSVAELKADIKKQIETEKEAQSQRAFENDIMSELAALSEVAIPKIIVDEEINRMEEEEKRNLVYRGQTWQEHLDAEKKTEEEHHEAQREQAALRVKTGVVLAEVAEKEKVSVTPEELESRIIWLKQQYTDAQMQAELDKPENRREITSRILTEKTIEKLVGYTTAK